MSIRDSIKDSIKNIASDIARMIQSRADTNLSNLSEKAEEVLDGKFVAQNMYETGAVLTDTWGYNQLVNMAHSTFDSSKFTTTYGSPSVSDDGIMSDTGSSSLSYIRVSFGDLTESDDWDIYFDYTTSESTASSSQINIIAGYQNVFSIYITANSTFATQTYYQDEDENWRHIGTGGNTYEKLAANTHYFLHYHYDSTTGYTLYWRTENESSWSVYGTNSDTTKTTVTNGYNLIGYDFTTGGQIDLKRYKVISEGIVLFNGTQSGTDTVTIDDEEVEIPYTLSKTGSKIVDAEYRELVQALYEQEGQALYYTIDRDNQNFTLPMGEVYGMITTLQEVGELTSDTNIEKLVTNVEELTSNVEELETNIDTLQTNIDTLQTNVDNTTETLQTNIDTLQNTVESDYLPLSGGTMTGSIKSNQNKVGANILTVTGIPDNSYADIQFYSDSSKRVATVRATNYDGYNTLILGAHDESNNAPAGLMVTNTDGTVTITGITPASSDSSTKIATTAFVKSVLSGSDYGMATYSKSSNGYIKFANGIIIQWGRTSSKSGTVTFPTSFSSSSSYAVTLNCIANNAGETYVTSLSASSFAYGLEDVNSASGASWTAIGY